MESLLELIKTIDLKFCGDFRKVLIHKLNNDMPINLEEIFTEVSTCETCKKLFEPELEKIKKEFTPFKIGSLLTNLLTNNK